MNKTLFSKKKCYVNRDFRASSDFSLIGVVFLFFPGILTTRNLSGVMNAYAYATFFEKKGLS